MTHTTATVYVVSSTLHFGHKGACPLPALKKGRIPKIQYHNLNCNAYTIFLFEEKVLLSIYIFQVSTNIVYSIIKQYTPKGWKCMHR